MMYIERTVTGKDGKAAFTSDLPLGQYYVKEIEAPKRRNRKI